MKDVDITNIPSENGLELSAKNLDCHITADFTFHEIITVSGHADIKIKDMSMDFHVLMQTQAGTPSTELAPKVTAETVLLKVDPANIDI